jgi:hypothetical protein
MPRGNAALRVAFLARVLHPVRRRVDQTGEKPSWVDALEESLLLAIGLFSLITWIIMIGLLGH